MAFALDGVINEEQILNIMIAKMRKALVAQNAVRYHSVPGGLSSIKIPGISDVEDQEYTGSDLDITDVTDEAKILVLNQRRSFAKTVDKVDDYEAAVNVVSEVIENGIYGIAKRADKFINTTITSDADVASLAGGQITISALNAVSTIIKVGVALDNLDVPESGRILMASPELAGALAEANISFSITTAEEAARTGFVGRFGGFDIFKSNNLADGAGSGKMCYAGIPAGGDFGQSLQTSDIVSTEKSFKWLIKGLSVYGSKVNNPNCYVKFDVTA